MTRTPIAAGLRLGLALISGVAPSGWTQTGRLGRGGQLAVSYAVATVFAGDSVLLMDEKWKKIEGHREAELAVKHVAGTSTAEYRGRLITLTKTMVKQAEGVDVTWDLAIKPEPKGVEATTPTRCAACSRTGARPDSGSASKATSFDTAASPLRSRTPSPRASRPGPPG